MAIVRVALLALFAASAQASASYDAAADVKAVKAPR